MVQLVTVTVPATSHIYPVSCILQLFRHNPGYWIKLKLVPGPIYYHTSNLVTWQMTNFKLWSWLVMLSLGWHWSPFCNATIPKLAATHNDFQLQLATIITNPAHNLQQLYQIRWWKSATIRAKNPISALTEKRYCYNSLRRLQLRLITNLQGDLLGSDH